MQKVVVLILTLMLCFSSSAQISNSRKPQQALFSTTNEILEKSWQVYKEKFIQKDGRTIEWKREQITTSEGQSYAMLRSVWMNDRPTFDLAYRWANENMRLRGDSLYSWKWGKNNEGKWSILDTSVATDADQDIAYALILAAKKWKEPNYETQAKLILIDLWKKTVVETSIGPVLTAGDWAPKQAKPTINPSYLAPYEYRLFASIDPDRPWMKLVDSSYKVLDSSANLSSVSLIPDWCAIEPSTGKILLAEGFTQGEGHSYDAWRTAWRVAFDAKVAPSTDKRASIFLKKNSFIFNYWIKNSRIPEAFQPDGSLRVDVENIATIGCYLPAFAVISPKVAQQLYEKSLLAGFNRMAKSGFWGDPLDYYAQNWVWFGIALWSGKTIE